VPDDRFAAGDTPASVARRLLVRGTGDAEDNRPDFRVGAAQEVFPQPRRTAFLAQHVLGRHPAVLEDDLGVDQVARADLGVDLAVAEAGHVACDDERADPIRVGGGRVGHT